MPKFYIDTTGKAHTEMPDGFFFEVEEKSLELASMPRNWINQSEDLFATIKVNEQDVMDIIHVDVLANLGLTNLEGLDTKGRMFVIFCHESQWIDAVKYYAESAKKHYVGLPVEVLMTTLPKYVGEAQIKKRNIEQKRTQRYLRRKGIRATYGVLFSGMLSDRIKPTADELEWMARVGREKHFEAIA